MNSRKFGFGSVESVTLLGEIREGRLTEFKPSLDISRGRVTYPSAAEAVGLTEEEALELLEFLASEEILLREPVESYHHCAGCGSVDLLVESHCDSCGSKLLQSAEAIAHLRCGFTDLAQRFSTSKGLKCPKCGKNLKQLGSDYRRVENYRTCLSCGKGGSTSKDNFRCQQCGAATEPANSKLNPSYVYRVNPDAAEKVRSHSVDLGEARRKLTEMGFSVSAEFRAKGKSGVYHDFDLAAWRSSANAGDDPPDLALRVATDEEDLPDTVVSEFMVSLNDTRTKIGVLAVVPGMSRAAAELAEFYGIKLAACARVEELPGSIDALLERVGQGGRVDEAPEQAQSQAVAVRPVSSRPDNSAAILMTVYERQSQSFDALQRLVEQLKVINTRLEELLGPSTKRMAAQE